MSTLQELQSRQKRDDRLPYVDEPLFINTLVYLCVTHWVEPYW